MVRRRAKVLSSALCRDVLSALDRVFAAEGPDEPDLALNVTYVRARLSLLRLATAEAWVVPTLTVTAIRARMTEVLATTRPGELERQLLSFPAWTLRALDRREADHVAPVRGSQRRRRSDVGPSVAVPRAYPAAAPTISR